MNAPSERVHFRNLDVIRFFAAFAVVIAHGFEAWKAHYIEFMWNPEETASLFSNSSFKTADTFFSNLGYGVELFFLISGFLISYLLLIEKQRHGKINLGKFWIRRSLRIWPIYFLLLCLGPLVTAWMKFGNPDYLSHALFYSNFQTIIDTSWEYPFAHYWSIAVEEQFYLLWPIFVVLIPIRHLMKVIIGLIIFSIGFRFVAFHNFEHPWYQIYLNTLSRMDTLLIGAAFAWLLAYKNWKPNINPYISKIALVVLLASFCFGSYVDYSVAWKVLWSKYFYLSCSVLFLFGFVFHPTFSGNGWLKRQLSYLGKISYGIYLFHNIVVIIVIKAILKNNEIYSWTLFGITYVCLTILLAIISFHFIEKPILKFKQKFAVVPTRKF